MRGLALLMMMLFISVPRGILGSGFSVRSKSSGISSMAYMTMAARLRWVFVEGMVPGSRSHSIVRLWSFSRLIFPKASYLPVTSAVSRKKLMRILLLIRYISDQVDDRLDHLMNMDILLFHQIHIYSIIVPNI